MPFLGKSGTSRISFFSGSQFSRCWGAGFDILPGSFDTKSCQAGDRLGFDFLDIIHAGRAGSSAQARSQSEQLIARSHGQNFHAAVGVIANPTRYTEHLRFAFDEPAKADALHPPADHEAA